jgi:hypothetical protein
VLGDHLLGGDVEAVPEVDVRDVEDERGELLLSKCSAAASQMASGTGSALSARRDMASVSARRARRR